MWKKRRGEQAADTVENIFEKPLNKLEKSFLLSQIHFLGLNSCFTQTRPHKQKYTHLVGQKRKKKKKNCKVSYVPERELKLTFMRLHRISSTCWLSL